jgi:hypothetical protein
MVGVGVFACTVKVGVVCGIGCVAVDFGSDVNINGTITNNATSLRLV